VVSRQPPRDGGAVEARVAAAAGVRRRAIEAQGNDFLFARFRIWGWGDSILVEARPHGVGSMRGCGREIGEKN
jgi:hypothetical protein